LLFNCQDFISKTNKNNKKDETIEILANKQILLSLVYFRERDREDYKMFSI